MTLDEYQDRYRALLEADPACCGGRMPPSPDANRQKGVPKPPRPDLIIDRLPRGRWFRAQDVEAELGVARTSVNRAAKSSPLARSRIVIRDNRPVVEWWISEKEGCEKKPDDALSVGTRRGS